MKKIMRTVTNEIRNYYFWVLLITKIYLVIDTSGGHRINETIKEYMNMILQQYDIKLFYQVPNSPETNLLDLGVWFSMQSKVESFDFLNRQDPCLLVQTVEKAWALFPV